VRPRRRFFFLGWGIQSSVFLCRLARRPVRWCACESWAARAGVTSYGSQICMTNSLRHVKAAPALAMSYLSIVLTVAYGYFIFHEARAARAQATRLACSVLKARVQELRALP